MRTTLTIHIDAPFGSRLSRFENSHSHIKFKPRININPSHMVAERSVEEQHLLSVAFHKVVDSRRVVRHVINHVKQKEKIEGNEQQANRAREHAVKLEAEFQKVCDGILTLMDENLTPSASRGELKVSYCKMKDMNTEEIQDHATKTQDQLVDAVENAEVTEIKRAVFRALTCLRAATIREFEVISVLETQTIDAYNDAHQYRGEDSLTHDSEIPQVECIDKTVDVPVVTRDQVLISQTVQKTVEVPRMQYTDRIVGVLVTTQCRVPTIQTAQGTVEVPQVQFFDRMDGVPVVRQRQAPQETIEETIEVPKTVSQGRIPQRTAEQITDSPGSQVVENLIEVSNGRVVDIPVLQVAEEFIEIFGVFSQSRVQQRIVEPITETPAVALAEEIVEALKDQTQEERILERTVEETDVHVPHVTEKITEVVKHIPQKRGAAELRNGTNH